MSDERRGRARRARLRFRQPSSACETKGLDRHGFVARLEEMMNRGRLMIEKRKDLASASKWEAQTQALLRSELGDHAYTKRFEVALSQPRPEGLVAAYGVLWAAYEDALKGDLKPVVKKSGPS